MSVLGILIMSSNSETTVYEYGYQFKMLLLSKLNYKTLNKHKILLRYSTGIETFYLGTTYINLHTLFIIKLV